MKVGSSVKKLKTRSINRGKDKKVWLVFKVLTYPVTSVLKLL